MARHYPSDPARRRNLRLGAVVLGPARGLTLANEPTSFIDKAFFSRPPIRRGTRIGLTRDPRTFLGEQGVTTFQVDCQDNGRR